MLEHHLFGSIAIRRRRFRPMTLAVFSYRYDEELVPDLLANIEPMVDGWVAFDDRKAEDLFSSEPRRRRLLIERAKDLGATWVLAIDPDERIEREGATRIRALTSERQRIIWEFNLREMFTASTYRVDGVWGSKLQGRLFPVFDGPLCSEQPLHGAWCAPGAGYSLLPAGLNLYHLKMLSRNRRQARRDLYRHLDPGNLYQNAGYDYLIDENGAEFEQLPPGRDFFPAHRDTGHSNLQMADVANGAGRSGKTWLATDKPHSITRRFYDRKKDGTTAESQLCQLRIATGDKVRHDSQLAVVVMGLRAPRSLLNAVRSLIEQDTASEIIVVNSGGGDVSGLLGEHLRSVVLVELSQPVHVGAARNIGIQVSNAPFVAFLAGDCIAAPGWVAERTQAHLDGEGAVASIVDNDRPRNPFAWAAHLVTYGHRMAGVTSREAVGYGASYDRALFDKYGYFSETMVIGEDSEFHERFRQSDPVCLHTSIRTIHCNPAGPISFLRDQFHRGTRGRYLADFFGLDFSAAYIALMMFRRIARAMRLSATRLRGKERLSAIASWPLLPVGALFYAAGMTASYVKARTAERLFRQGAREVLLRRPKGGIDLLKRAINLRPATARYHLALGALLRDIGKHDDGARQLYASWDIDRPSITDLYWVGESIGAANAQASPSAGSVGLQLVLFSDCSDMQLMECLRGISHQSSSEELDVMVVEARDRSRVSELTLQVRQAYGYLARFVSPAELPGLLSLEDRDGNAPSRCFVVVSSCSCVPPPSWLAVLRAYILTYPEVDVFQGQCIPEPIGAGFVERISYDLGLFPRTPGQGGALLFGHAANFACDRSLLIGSGGLNRDEANAMGLLTLKQRVMKAGGSYLYAPDWQTRFQMDSTLVRLLRRFYRDGYYGAEYVIAAKDRDRGSRFFSARGLYGSMAAAWRFSIENFNVWRFADRSFLHHAPAFLLLLLVALARQLGWLAGLREFRGGRSESFGPGRVI